MKKIIILIILLSAITFNNLYAQQDQRKGKQSCATTFNLDNLKKNDPEAYARFLKNEKHIQDYKNSQERLINNNSIIIIPVVVHILHNGEAVGTGNNLSDAQIQSQITVLNQDFRRLNADASNTPSAFTGVAADCNIEFRLACVDPNGNATNGIHRVQTSVTVFTPVFSGDVANETAMGIKYTSTGGTDAWPTNKYLNIWVCNLGLIGPLQLLGYAQFPVDYASKPNTDGIVAYSQAFGVANNFPGFAHGRNVTHEVGHWLDLYHIWGTNASGCGDSDFCNDTPNQDDAAEGGPPNNNYCPFFPQISCSNGSNGDMFMNYMDYGEDLCKNLFTADQKARMRACFTSGGYRESFIDNYFHINDFTGALCVEEQLSVTNLACLSPVTWTVVSGPATISAGQGTNTVTIQSTGDGYAVIQATAAGYVDDIEVVIGNPFTVWPFVLGPDPECLQKNRPVLYGANEYPEGAQLVWGYIPGIAYSPITYVDNGGIDQCTITVPNYNQYNTIYVAVQNECGVGMPAMEVFEFQDDCGPWQDWRIKPQGPKKTEVLKKGFSLSPNPATDLIVVNIPVEYLGKSSLRILDVTGKIIKVIPAIYSRMNIDIRDLKAGLYVLQLSDKTDIHSIKFIKQ